MSVFHKNIQDLVPSDMDLSPIWEFALDNEVIDDTTVSPVYDIPVRSLDNRVVGTQVRLNNGRLVWAMLGNINLSDALRTEHFRKLSIFHSGQWFFLARYHDYDYEERGPAALSAFLGLGEREVFPIVYDIRYCCVGDPNIVVDAIEAEPRAKLERSELIALAVP